VLRVLQEVQVRLETQGLKVHRVPKERQVLKVREDLKEERGHKVHKELQVPLVE
jgi:hypothetical protein